MPRVRSAKAQIAKLLLSGGFLLALVACGGGGDPSTSSPVAKSATADHGALDRRFTAAAMTDGSGQSMELVLGANAGADPVVSAMDGEKLKRPLNTTPGTLSGTLIWSNGSGQTVAWGMSGTTRISKIDLLDAPGWQVTHNADFNGDSKPDLLWQNFSTGQTTVWLTDGANLLQSQLLLTAPGWRVTSVADFNGDGKADLLWYNALAGQTAMWLMNGVVPIATQPLLSDGDWRVTQVGDFDGDGSADLLWYAPFAGQTAVWLMNGTVRKLGSTVLAAPGWQVIAVADLNGDRRSDLVWYNEATGQTTLWLMNGLATPTSALVLTDPDWRVQFAADLDGNGKADLIWENRSAGQTAAWLMDGLTRVSGATLLAVPGWRVSHVSDLSGDGKADLVWISESSGQTVAWLMNGLSVTQNTLLLADPTFRVTGVAVNTVPASNAPPVARIAALPSSVPVSVPILLSGTSSSDANGDPLTYTWSITSRPMGSRAQLVGANTAIPSLTPDAVGTFVLSLTVSDGKSSSTAVTSVSTRPSVNALFGLVTLTYRYSNLTTVYTDQVIFSAIDISSSGTSVIDFILGTSRLISCGPSTVREYLCLTVYPNGDTEAWMFDVVAGQIVNGTWEYCLAFLSSSECANDHLFTPDGPVVGSVVPALGGGNSGPMSSGLSSRPVDEQAEKRGSDSPGSSRTMDADPRTVEQLSQALDALKEAAKRSAGSAMK